MGLRCMSCCSAVSQTDAKLFAQVFCCPACYELARRFMERAEKDLNHLRTMMLETVRQGLLEGKLQFASGSLEDVSKKDLLTALADMAETARKKTEQCQTPLDQDNIRAISSGESTKLLAKRSDVGG